MPDALDRIPGVRGLTKTCANGVQAPRRTFALAERHWDRWLDTAFSDAAMLSELPHPFDPGALEAWRVSRRVNAPRNQGPELIAREDCQGSHQSDLTL